ncbi:DUF6318 family protein [Pedococcus sp. NPDC057267]|uniref:DUF6318 family protein n=1 Tax=Pedococcus sp. NPDC057267 TaxID=3346077 RepID=UPI00363C3C93
MQVRRGAFTAVVASSLALAACTGGGDSPPSTTSSTSSSRSSTTSSTTTQSPSPTKTVALPPEATQHTEAGARAFAKYFVSVLDDSQVSADPTALEAVSGDACKGCKAYVDMSRQLAAKGQRQQRTALSLKDMYVRPGATADAMTIDLLIDEAPSKTVDRGGVVVESFPADKTTLRITLQWRGQSWVAEQAVAVV